MRRHENPSIDLAERRRGKVIEYVKQNPKTTKNNVVNYMTKNGSSLMTTHKILKDLEKHGIIKVDKPNSQMSYLIINENNEINKIYNSLSEIENIIDMVDEPLNKISEIEFGTHNPSFDVEIADLLRNFQGPYEKTMNIILQELISRIDNKIHSEKDKQILYTKIIKLLQKFIVSLSHTDRKIVEQLDYLISQLKYVKKAHFVEAEKSNFYLINDCKAMAEKFERVLENFKKQFLSEV